MEKGRFYLAAPREELLGFGFSYDAAWQRYVEDEREYGGELFINDDESFFRVSMFCEETADDCFFENEHIAAWHDQYGYTMGKLIEARIAVWKPDESTGQN